MNWLHRKAVLISREDDLEEALALIKCLDNVSIVKVVSLKRNYRVDNKSYIRKGKLEQLKQELESLEYGVDTLYVYDVLKPRQVVNLMRSLKVDVKDKVGLILEIFAAHAGSKEAKLQIEMADILHKLPLIKEWIRRAKMGELPGFMGPGRYAVDAYYTHMRRRLSKIKRELEELRARRSLARSQRVRKGMQQVAIAGYANAGKTTLFNRITSERKPVGPEMFTTLTPKSKAASLNGKRVIFVDTVGFIRDVPHEVIEAFYATLEEIALSDLTILVLDSSENISLLRRKLLSSLDTLRRIGYVGKPLIVALNKIDAVDDVDVLVRDVGTLLSKHYYWAWHVTPISALKGYGINALLEAVYEYLQLPSPSGNHTSPPTSEVPAER